MAALLLQQLQKQAAAGDKKLAKIFEPVMAHEYLPGLNARILEGMLGLGLDPGKRDPESRQTLLHAALYSR